MFRIFVVIYAMSCAMAAFAADTVLKLYRPFAETETHAPLTIQSKRSGHCLQQSERIKREDAWRCVGEDHLIHDPCFSKRFGSDRLVICPLSPWLRNSIQLTLDSPLDASQQVPLDISRTLPWAIELKSGERCLSVDSKQMIDGLLVRYYCRVGVVLVGDIHRCKPVWTTLKHDSSGISMVEIESAWF